MKPTDTTRRPRRYLVMVDFPEGRHPPIAGVYVTADTPGLAKAQVRQLLADAKLTTYLKP